MKSSYFRYLLFLGVVLILFGSNGNATYGSQESNDTLSYADVELNNTELNDSEELTYKNTNPYAVELTNKNIEIICTGTGSTKEEDEILAKKNFKVFAKFKKNGEKTAKERIILEKNEEAIIEISSSYEGIKPQNEVSCQFGIDIGIA